MSNQSHLAASQPFGASVCERHVSIAVSEAACVINLGPALGIKQRLLMPILPAVSLLC